MYLNYEEQKKFKDLYEVLKKRIDTLQTLLSFSGLSILTKITIKEIEKDIKKIDSIIYDNLPAFINSSGNTNKDQSDINNEGE